MCAIVVTGNATQFCHLKGEKKTVVIATSQLVSVPPHDVMVYITSKDTRVQTPDLINCGTYLHHPFCWHRSLFNFI